MGSQRPGVLPPPGAEVGVAPYPIVKVVHALPVPRDVNSPALGRGRQRRERVLDAVQRGDVNAHVDINCFGSCFSDGALIKTGAEGVSCSSHYVRDGGGGSGGQ